VMARQYGAGGAPLGAWHGPYLKAEPVLHGWGSGKVRVGFAWQGDPRQPHDFNRRIPFSEFATFASAFADRYSFVSLQTKFAGNCAPWEGWPAEAQLFDASTDIADYAAAAAWLKSCDVFVGQCGSMLHLAGALGVPAVAMLGAAHDWRWDFEPLYGENFHLVFQDRPGHWPSAFAQLAGAIQELMDRQPAEFHERQVI
jgi:hypothetical protein